MSPDTHPFPPPGDEIRTEAFAAGPALPAELPRRILVAPFGEVASTKGAFIVDREAMREIVAAFTAHGADLPIDFEHQTLGGAFSSPSGLAPAAGWVKALQAVLPDESVAGASASDQSVACASASDQEGARPQDIPQSTSSSPAAAGDPQFPEPGLWAEVEWTPLAAELLRAKQYRYLSPVALVRRGDRRMVGLHSIALTNKPAIAGMRPVVATDSAPAIRVTVAEPPALARLRMLVALDDGAGADDVLAAAADRIALLQQDVSSRAAEDRVARASAAGKLAPCQRDWAFALALRDPVAFEGWLAAAPMVVPLGQTEPPDAEDSSGALHAVERCARREYRQHVDVLGRLCSEEAYVADARRRG